MKNFPNTLGMLKTSSIITDVKNVLHAEWNLNRYIDDSEISVTDTIPTTDDKEELLLESDQIKKMFPVKEIVKSNRGSTSSYVIDGTRYRTKPTYQTQAGRSDSSWQEDTTWLWYGEDARYQYWTSSLASDSNKALPYNVGRIQYTWTEPKDINKIYVQFQKDNAFPQEWTIAVDITGDQNWQVIANNPSVPADGVFELWRDTVNERSVVGDWETSPARWRTDFRNEMHCYGIRIKISTVDIKSARPAIIELSPRLEANLTSEFIEWDFTEELGDSDFINPVGVASANTGSVILSNRLGIFNENQDDLFRVDIDNKNELAEETHYPFHKMLDENVNFRGYLKYNNDTIPMFNAVSDSWRTEGFDKTTVQLVDGAKALQSTSCNDMLVDNVSAGTGLHMMFASLGLTQFNLSGVGTQGTPGLERFHTRREQKVWDVVSEVCKGLQMSAIFDSEGVLQIFNKETIFNKEADVDYGFTSEKTTDRVPDLFSLTEDEFSRFNKVTIRYKSLDKFSKSGGANQKLWEAPDPWTLGAANIVRDISAGDNYFVIDPEHPENLPRRSGILLIDGINNPVEYEGMRYYCKNYYGPEGKHFKVKKPEDWYTALEKNNGEAPKFTGRVYLKDKKNGDPTTFNKSYGSKAYRFLKEWDVIQFQEGSKDGKVMTSGAKHEPKDGALFVKTDYAGSRRLVISKKIRDWKRFDRVGIKFKTESTGSRVGVVLYPQGSSGQAGYYFVVNTFNREERKRLTIETKSGDENTITQTNPEIHGFYIGGAGNRTNLNFDTARDFKDQSPTKVGIYNYLEVAVFPTSKGLEFEVYVNGQYCKTFIDNGNTLSRNQKAGMVFMGSGANNVTKFYVVNYPKGTVRDKDQDNSDRFVRGKDLWRDRKASPGDGSFNNHLKALDKLKKTQVYENDFSGRYYAVAREKLRERVRFEEDKGGETSRLVVTNNAAAVVRYEPSSYGARFTLINKADKDILLKGSAGVNKGDEDKIESMYITGKSFRRGEDQEVEYKDKELIDRIGELPLEFESPWIQDRETAEDLGKWVMKRFGGVSAKYTISCFGNPLLEVGDIVTIQWPEKGFTIAKSNPNSSRVQKFVILSVNRSWNDGLETSVSVREII